MTPSQRLALNGYLKKWSIAPPQGLIDFSTIFGNDQPLTIEIGFGMGDSLASMAKHNPDRNFIGIEVHTPGIGRLLALVEKDNLDNVRVIQADAVEVLRDNIDYQSIDQINIFFPDPWHKQKHHKRRLIQQTFLTLLHARLCEGGLLHIATDWAPYADYVNKLMNTNLLFENIHGKNRYADPKKFGRPTTKFERRGLRLGHEVRDMVFISIANKKQ